MPVLELTDRLLRSLLQRRGEDFRDERTPGLELRIRSSGKATWSLLYRAGGRGARQRRLTLGSYPAVSLAEARNLAREHQVLIARGLDPSEELEKKRSPPSGALTVSALIEAYLAGHPKAGTRWVLEQERTLRRDVIPVLGSFPAEALRKGQVALLLDGLVARGAPVWANRLRAILLRVYNWGMARDLVERNPVMGVPRPTEEHTRGRVLSPGEIALLWTALADLEPPTSLCLALELLTGQRGGEILHMRLEDLSGEWWTIPRVFTKMKKADHRVYLSPTALNLVAKAEPRNGWMFPSPLTGEPMLTTAPSRALSRLRARRRLAHFTPHDLRRTVETNLAELGVTDEVREAILGHRPPKLRRTYNLYRFDAERKDALLRWEQRLLTILQDGGTQSHPAGHLGGDPADPADGQPAAQRKSAARFEATDGRDREAHEGTDLVG